MIIIIMIIIIIIIIIIINNNFIDLKFLFQVHQYLKIQ